MLLCETTNDLFCFTDTGAAFPLGTRLVVRGRLSLSLGLSLSFPAGLKVCLV